MVNPTRFCQADLELAYKIVNMHPVAKANLALLGDKRFIFNENRTAFIMYVVQGRSWIALGDPVGTAEAVPALVHRFYEACAREGGRPVFYEVQGKHLATYEKLGMRAVKIAEEGRVAVETFTLEGREKKDLRNAVRKAEKEGCRFEMMSEVTPAMLLELRAVSDEWLESKPAREKRFSLGFFDEDYLSHFSVGVIRREGRIIAFVTVWSGWARTELFLDLMRSFQDVPRGTMDLLFVRLMQWAQAEGYTWFNLGMSPLPEPIRTGHRTIWDWFLAVVRRVGERFYNAQGIRRYKEKFDPEWTPRYVIAHGHLPLLRGLMDVVVLTSGGKRGVLPSSWYCIPRKGNLV